MRICLYTETALPKMGGQEVVVDALAREYQDLGHDCVVLAPRPRWPLRCNDKTLPYPVARHPRFFSAHIMVGWYKWFLQRLHRKQPFDVLHCHGIYPPAYLASLCGHTLPVPVAVTSHGGDVNPKNVRLAKPIVRARHREALRAADALIAISRFTREEFLALGADPAKIVDIPNGVHIEPLANPPERPGDLPGDIGAGSYVYFIGRLRKRKGVDVLLEALARVPDDGSVQVVVAGEGGERQALEAMCQRLGLQRRVRFVGQIVARKSSGWCAIAWPSWCRRGIGRPSGWWSSKGSRSASR